MEQHWLNKAGICHCGFEYPKVNKSAQNGLGYAILRGEIEFFYLEDGDVPVLGSHSREVADRQVEIWG